MIVTLSHTAAGNYAALRCDKCRAESPPFWLTEVSAGVSYPQPSGWGKYKAGQVTRDCCPACQHQEVRK